MTITHHLRMWLRDHDSGYVECLCNKDSGILIISNVLHRRKGERWFVEFLDLFEHREEKLRGFARDGVCYYEP